MKPGKKLRLSSKEVLTVKNVAASPIIISLLFMIYLNQVSELAAAVWFFNYFSISFFIGICLYCSSSLKKVWMEHNKVYVWHFIEDIVISLSRVRKISELKLFNPRGITIQLKQKSIFGNRNVFLGYPKQWLLLGTHPAISRMEKRIKK